MKRIGLLVVFICIFAITGFITNAQAAKGKVEIAYVEWACATASAAAVPASSGSARKRVVRRR